MDNWPMFRSEYNHIKVTLLKNFSPCNARTRTHTLARIHMHTLLTLQKHFFPHIHIKDSFQEKRSPPSSWSLSVGTNDLSNSRNKNKPLSHLFSGVDTGVGEDHVCCRNIWWFQISKGFYKKKVVHTQVFI